MYGLQVLVVDRSISKVEDVAMLEITKSKMHDVVMQEITNSEIESSSLHSAGYVRSWYSLE